MSASRIGRRELVMWLLYQRDKAPAGLLKPATNHELMGPRALMISRLSAAKLGTIAHHLS
jgi:hypothetical protein